MKTSKLQWQWDTISEQNRIKIQNVPRRTGFSWQWKSRGKSGERRVKPPGEIRILLDVDASNDRKSIDRIFTWCASRAEFRRWIYLFCLVRRTWAFWNSWYDRVSTSDTKCQHKQLSIWIAYAKNCSLSQNFFYIITPFWLRGIGFFFLVPSVHSVECNTSKKSMWHAVRRGISTCTRAAPQRCLCA